MNLVDYCSAKFTNQELVKICEFLGIKTSNRMGNRFLIDSIVYRVETNGLPSESIPELEDFLYIMLYINDKGNFQNPNIQVGMTENLECYGYASDLDSKCSSCLAYQYCSNALSHKLPDCFGVLWGESDECLDCMVQESCGWGYRFNVKTGIDKKTNVYEVFLFEELPILTNILNRISIFRKIHKGWPSKILLDTYNRLKEFSFRNIEIKKKKGLIRDAIYLYTYKVKKDEDIKVTPLVFDGERRPVIDENRSYFRDRRTF